MRLPLNKPGYMVKILPYLCDVKNYIVRSCRIVTVVANSVTMRTIKATLIIM